MTKFSRYEYANARKKQFPSGRVRRIYLYFPAKSSILAVKIASPLYSATKQARGSSLLTNGVDAMIYIKDEREEKNGNGILNLIALFLPPFRFPAAVLRSIHHNSQQNFPQTP